MQCGGESSLQPQQWGERPFPKFLQCLQPEMSQVLCSFQESLQAKEHYLLWWSTAELPGECRAVAVGSFPCQSCSLGSFRPINVNFTEEMTCRTSVSDSRIDAYFFLYFFLPSWLNSMFSVSLFLKGCLKVCEHFRKRTTRTTAILVKIPSVIFIFLHCPLCLLD